MPLPYRVAGEVARTAPVSDGVDMAKLERANRERSGSGGRGDRLFPASGAG